MDNVDIKEQAQRMAKDIKSIVDYYNKLIPDFSFYPVITMTETSTSEGVFKGISVEVEVSYNTRQGAIGPILSGDGAAAMAMQEKRSRLPIDSTRSAATQCFREGKP